jgi:hypothetical protein
VAPRAPTLGERAAKKKAAQQPDVAEGEDDCKPLTANEKKELQHLIDERMKELRRTSCDPGPP